MGYEPSETVKRTQKILESIEEKRLLRSRLVGERNVKNVEIEQVDRGLEQLRKQLEVELLKVDPDRLIVPSITISKASA